MWRALSPGTFGVNRERKPDPRGPTGLIPLILDPALFPGCFPSLRFPTCVSRGALALAGGLSGRCAFAWSAWRHLFQATPSCGQRRLMMSHHKRPRAFTLVELLVVI